MSPTGRGPGGATRTRTSPRRAPGPADAGRERPNRREPPPPRRVLGLRLRVVVALALVLAVALVGTAWFSPLLSVRSVQVQGAGAVSSEQLVAALDVPVGTPLLRVDVDAAAARVAALPRVASARVERSLPSTLRLVVRERVAVAWFAAPDGQHLVDATGVDFAQAEPATGTPRLTTDAPGPGDPATTSALAVLGSLPSALRTQVVGVGASTPAAVVLTLRDGRTVRWGDDGQAQRKAAVLTALLSQPGRVYDVASPDLPTIS